MRTPERYDREQIKEAKAHVKEVKEFFEHVGAYLAINGILFLIDMYTGTGTWFHWPLFGWGIVVVGHGIGVFAKPHFHRFVKRLENREMKRFLDIQQSTPNEGTSFSNKLKEAIGTGTLKNVGQEISKAMKELETELGDFGLHWNANVQKKVKPQAAHKAKIPQGVAILLFTDIEGFSTYTERHGDEAGHNLLKLHNRVIREAVAQHEGIEVKQLGDGFMLCFTSARKALICAASIQEKLEESEFPLGVRLGVHAGEPIQDDQDLLGQTVNITARIMDQANGGQILISEVVKNLAGTLKGFQYVDHGKRRLAGLSQPQRLYEFHPIDALSSPLDSEIDHRLNTMEKEL